MTTDPNILNELQQIAPTLAGISRRMPYSVPDNYFGYLADRMLIEVTPAPQTGDVPEGYFDQFADNMLQLIRQQNGSHELADVAPTLVSINREMPYHVPTGYFENLNPAVPEPAKVVSMSSKKIWWRMAVAAVLLIGGFSVWQLSNNSGQTTNSSIDVANAINDTMAIPQEISIQLATLDAYTIENAFTETEQTTGHTEAAYLLETDNFEQALQAVSAEAISEQLEKIPVTQKNI